MMNKVIFFSFFTVFPLILNAQEKEERRVGSFNRIDVGEAIIVYLHPSNEERVVVEATNVDLEDVETEVDGDELDISLDGNIFKNVKVRVDVYFKNLVEISASSASSVYGEKVIRGNDFEITVSSAGYVDIKLDVNQLNVKASSSGDAKISGKAHEAELSSSSAGSINASDLITEIADIRASSAGNVRLQVTKSIEASASSGGSIRYSGSPSRSNISSSSGGSVKKSD